MGQRMNKRLRNMVFTLTVIGFTAVFSLFIKGCDNPILGIIEEGVRGNDESPTELDDGPYTIKLRTQPNGEGEEIALPLTLKGLNTLTVYAARYNAESAYVQDIEVDWSGSGMISGNLSAATGTNTSFLALQIEGTGQITATHSEYGAVSTPNITVDNKVYLKESIMCWINTSSPGLASKPATGWDVYGGQSYMGYYSRIAFAWPELTGLPENPDFVEIQVYHWSCQSSTLPNNRHVSIYDINATWEDSSIPSWDGGRRMIVVFLRRLMDVSVVIPETVL